jgi:hypothetical protein
MIGRWQQHFAEKARTGCRGTRRAAAYLRLTAHWAERPAHHWARSFKRSRDEGFADVAPPAHTVVLPIDEKS